MTEQKRHPIDPESVSFSRFDWKVGDHTPIVYGSNVYALGRDHVAGFAFTHVRNFPNLDQALQSLENENLDPNLFVTGVAIAKAESERIRRRVFSHQEVGVWTADFEGSDRVYRWLMRRRNSVTF